MIKGLLFVLALIASTQAVDCGALFGQTVNGACWVIASFNTAQPSCTTKCASEGLEHDDDQIINFAGSGAANLNGCQAIVDAFSFAATVEDVSGTECQNSGVGCFYKTGESLRCTSPTTTSAAFANPTGVFEFGGRFCACKDPASSGGQDPHFHGLNGEHLDIVIDSASSNEIFNIYCDENYVVNALFSPNAKGYLFMTEFYGKLNGVKFNLKLDRQPQFYGNFYVDEKPEDQNRTTYVLSSGGIVESDGNIMIAKFDDLQINIRTASDVEKNVYFDIDIIPRGDSTVRRPASGIIGRSFERKYSAQEFSAYHHFKLDFSDDKFSTCNDPRFK